MIVLDARILLGDSSALDLSSLFLQNQRQMNGTAVWANSGIAARCTQSPSPSPSPSPLPPSFTVKRGTECTAAIIAELELPPSPPTYNTACPAVNQGFKGHDESKCVPLHIFPLCASPTGCPWRVTVLGVTGDALARSTLYYIYIINSHVLRRNGLCGGGCCFVPAATCALCRTALEPCGPRHNQRYKCSGMHSRPSYQGCIVVVTLAFQAIPCVALPIGAQSCIHSMSYSFSRNSNYVTGCAFSALCRITDVIDTASCADDVGGLGALCEEGVVELTASLLRHAGNATCFSMFCAQ